MASVELSLLPQAAQTGADVCEKMTVGEAVSRGLINNETLGYYMARTQLFMLHIGIDKDRLRFRQHLSTEMAHYAADCQDTTAHHQRGGAVQADVLLVYDDADCPLSRGDVLCCV